jgi:hypothetical protein
MADGWRATTFGEITPKIVIQFSSLHGSPALSLYLSLSLSPPAPLPSGLIIIIMIIIIIF